MKRINRILAYLFSCGGVDAAVTRRYACSGGLQAATVGANTSGLNRYILANILVIAMLSSLWMAVAEPVEELEFDLPEDSVSMELVGVPEENDILLEETILSDELGLDEIVLSDDPSEISIDEEIVTNYADNSFLQLNESDSDFEIDEDGVLIMYHGLGGDVTIPDSVTSIGKFAFYHCDLLTSVSIPNGVTRIGEDAFCECYSLTSVTIPNSVTVIGDKAFYNCRRLKSVAIPDSVTTIGEAAFYGCFYIDVNLPDSIRSIGNSAFYECSGLTSVSIPKGVTHIGDAAFRGCYNLSSVTIPNSVTTIGYAVFYECRRLSNVTIPSSVTSIGDKAFVFCDSLTRITIPSSVTSIGDSAFNYDTLHRLSSLVIYGETGSYTEAYANAHDIPFISINSGDTADSSDFIIDANGMLVKYRGSDLNVAIPAGITGIGASAFAGCLMNTITIPDSVTTIGRGAFFLCSQLVAITVSDDNPNYTSLDGILYTKNMKTLIVCPAMGCPSSIIIPDGVERIEAQAFLRCSNLNNITVPESVSSIGEEAFSQCTNLTSIDIPYGVSSIGKDTFWDCESLSSVTLPNSLTDIGYRAFCLCEHLTSISIPDGVTSIGFHAFSGCIKLTDINIPNSVKNIGEGAFTGCRMSSMNIPEGVTSIGMNAFQSCAKLSNINISSSVKNIVEGAFFNCPRLEAITVSESNPWYTSQNGILYTRDMKTLVQFPSGKTDTSIVIPKELEQIGGYAFAKCKNLTSVNIPDSVTGIGEYAFYDTGLTNIIIPNNVTSIGFNAFANCSNLKSIALPNGITTIEKNTFNHCKSLKKIIIPDSVVSIGSYAFYECSRLTSIYILSGNTSTTINTFESCRPVIYTVPGSNVAENMRNYRLTVNEIDMLLLTEDAERAVNTGDILLILINGDTVRSFKSSDNKVATVSQKGNVKVKGYGTAEISVALATGETRVLTLKNPYPSASLSKTSLSLNVGDTYTLAVNDLAGRGVTWVSSDDKIATVKKGTITAKSRGNCTVTAQIRNGENLTCRVSVIDKAKLSKKKLSLSVGKSAKLKASHLAGRRVTWSSSDKKIATVKNGTVTALREGTCIITAQIRNGDNLTCKVTVIDRARLSKTKLSLSVGRSAKLKVNHLAGRRVAWSSSDKMIASVKNGTVTALREGKCTITAEVKNGKKLTCKITVTATKH